MQGSYEPGTVLTRGEGDDDGFYGPDGQRFVGRVLCKDLRQGTDGEMYFTPVVPEPRRRPLLQTLWLEIQVKLGWVGKFTHPDGEVSYMYPADRDFIKRIYGDSVDIE